MYWYLLLQCSSLSNSAVASREDNTPSSKEDEAPPLVLYRAEKEYNRRSKACCCPHPPPKRALKGVNLQLKAGELFGLLGPNGAGKTTAMKLIVGDEAPTRGQVCKVITFINAPFGIDGLPLPLLIYLKFRIMYSFRCSSEANS